MPQGFSNNLSKEDISKILSEINQIINQRFQLTISAITVFGVFIAWIIPKEDTSIQRASDFLFAAPILLLIFLFLLFLYAHNLNRTLNTLSTYLRVTEQSKWEKDFAAFTGDRYVGYGFIENMIFILLGLITSLFPFMLCFLSKLEFPASHKIRNVLIISGAIYTVVVAIMSFSRRRRSYEIRAEQRWKQLLKEEKI